MTTKLFQGGTVAEKGDTCQVELTAPDKPGDYRVRVRRGPEIFSEAILHVEPAPKK